MHRRTLRYCTTFLLLLAFLFGDLSTTTPAAAAGDQCFAETGQCISGRIRIFWEQNGGLSVFGLPLTRQLTTANGLTFQAFERHIIELHPENAAPYDVELTPIGVFIYEARGNTSPSPAVPANSNCRFFAETGHNVCEPFLSMWHSKGLNLDRNPAISEAENLGLFGLPISEAYDEVLSDGVSHTIQWFERGRMEVHPEAPAAYRVQMGLLGAEWVSWVLKDTPPAPPADATQPPPTTQPAEPAPAPAKPTPAPARKRIGAVCKDGTRSNATGRGACSHHGGVDHWIYEDGKP